METTEILNNYLTNPVKINFMGKTSNNNIDKDQLNYILLSNCTKIHQS